MFWKGEPMGRAIDMRLNLNDEIKVKLTEHGKDIYYHQYDRLNTAFGREICKPKYPEVDENGYTTFQLWCFMELYGVNIGMTLPNVIEPIDIVFDASTIEPERKKGKWINISDGVFEIVKCDQCGRTMDSRDNFCPKCGSYNGGDEDVNE
jgi:predicted nucleic-acid-binding Zn-ribbon protein